MDKETESNDVSTKMQEYLQNRWIAIFNELSNSERFVNFIKDNYVIDEVLNEEDKTITVRVIEKPFITKIDISVEQTMKLQQLLNMYGVKKTVDCLKDIVKVLENKGKESKIIV